MSRMPRRWKMQAFLRHCPKLTRRNYQAPYPKPTITRHCEIYTVKIENVSKNTNEEDLRGRLELYFHDIESIHIRYCSNSPANYAYVNCYNAVTADSIVERVDKKMLLHSNLLSAKLKKKSSDFCEPRVSGSVAEGSSTSQMLPTEFVPANKPSSGVELGSIRDVATVKVLIYAGIDLTDKHLDMHFAKFGELSSPCKIRKGAPDYVYVNFKDPVSAQEARKESPCRIQGATLTALPMKASKTFCYGEFGESSTKVGFINKVHPCDPLAVKYAVEDINQRLKECNSLMLKLNPVKNAISVSVDETLADQVGCVVRRSISTQEAKIGAVEEVMESLHLPILANRSTQEQFLEIQVPFEVNIFEAGSYVPLERLTHTCSKFDEMNFDELSQYLLQPAKAEESADYRWYWEDEFAFKPYDSSVSQNLEQMYVSRLSMVLPIGPNHYQIDTCSMTQTNTRTGNVRKVERRSVLGARKHNISIQVRAHSDHLQEAQREIRECMQRNVKEVKVSIPPYGQDTSSVDRLLQIAHRIDFVFAQKTYDNEILLQGRQDIVTSVELQLTKEILQMKPREVEVVKVQSNFDAMKRPECWEVQECNCELKMVSQGSTEFTRIVGRMTEPRFRVKVLRIERIQNLLLWEAYGQSRKRVSDKNNGHVNEEWLFHGTRETPPVKIYNSEQGFDSRLSSRGMWGEGAYFAVRAQYSNNYAYTTPEGHRQMFFVKVITGITRKCQPDSSLKAPPVKTDRSPSLHSSGSKSKFEDERYDSVSGDAGTSEVFVIYEHGKVYPAYLITYVSEYHHFVL